VTIARELISAKLNGQAVLVREKLRDVQTENAIVSLRSRLGDAVDLNVILGIESRAAAEFWSAWRDLPIRFRERTQAESRHIG
jgi:CRISPR/Cas system-associated endonuclease Cas1